MKNLRNMIAMMAALSAILISGTTFGVGTPDYSDPNPKFGLKTDKLIDVTNTKRQPGTAWITIAEQTTDATKQGGTKDTQDSAKLSILTTGRNKDGSATLKVMTLNDKQRDTLKAVAKEVSSANSDTTGYYGEVKKTKDEYKITQLPVTVKLDKKGDLKKVIVGQGKNRVVIKA